MFDDIFLSISYTSFLQIKSTIEYVKFTCGLIDLIVNLHISYTGMDKRSMYKRIKLNIFLLEFLK
jgi:hypothetical protein